MALDLTIGTDDFKQLQKDLESFGHRAPNLIAQSMNKATTGVRTDSVRRVSKLMNVAQRRVRRESYIRKAHRRKLSTHFGYRDARKPNAKSTRGFKGGRTRSGRLRKGGITFNTFGKVVNVPSGFVVRGKTAFVREGRRRLPIRPVTVTLNAAQTVDNDPRPEYASFWKRFQVEIRRRLDFELRKRGFK